MARMVECTKSRYHGFFEEHKECPWCEPVTVAAPSAMLAIPIEFYRELAGVDDLALRILIDNKATQALDAVRGSADAREERRVYVCGKVLVIRKDGVTFG